MYSFPTYTKIPVLFLALHEMRIVATAELIKYKCCNKYCDLPTRLNLLGSLIIIQTNVAGNFTGWPEHMSVNKVAQAHLFNQL